MRPRVGLGEKRKWGKGGNSRVMKPSFDCSPRGQQGKKGHRSQGRGEKKRSLAKKPGLRGE